MQSNTIPGVMPTRNLLAYIKRAAVALLLVAMLAVVAFWISISGLSGGAVVRLALDVVRWSCVAGAALVFAWLVIRVARDIAPPIFTVAACVTGFVFAPKVTLGVIACVALGVLWLIKHAEKQRWGV